MGSQAGAGSQTAASAKCRSAARGAKDSASSCNRTNPGRLGAAASVARDRPGFVPERHCRKPALTGGRFSHYAAGGTVPVALSPGAW
jgi:hypothetical protein